MTRTEAKLFVRKWLDQNDGGAYKDVWRELIEAPAACVNCCHSASGIVNQFSN